MAKVFFTHHESRPGWPLFVEMDGSITVDGGAATLAAKWARARKDCTMFAIMNPMGGEIAWINPDAVGAITD